MGYEKEFGLQLIVRIAGYKEKLMTHVEIMAPDRIPKLVINYQTEGKRSVGKLRTGWCCCQNSSYGLGVKGQKKKSQ